VTALTIILAVVLVLVAAFIALILVANRISDRTYKPTVSEMIRQLEDCKAGRMDSFQYDEFSCVRIAYDPRLDAIRQKFNDITDDPQNIEGNFSETDETALNDAGKNKIEELIDELRQLDASRA
jgi:signal transduction histidine kinase